MTKQYPLDPYFVSYNRTAQEGLLYIRIIKRTPEEYNSPYRVVYEDYLK
jgi:hypothetical protein